MYWRPLTFLPDCLVELMPSSFRTVFYLLYFFPSLSTSFHTTIFTDSYWIPLYRLSVHQLHGLNFLCDFPGVHKKRFLTTLFIFKYHYTASHVVQIIRKENSQSLSPSPCDSAIIDSVTRVYNHLFHCSILLIPLDH